METKNYTDIEQSKKLAKILPFESADMCWFVHADDEDFATKIAFVAGSAVHYAYEKITDWNDTPYIPAWSLAALLKLLPQKIEHEGNEAELHINSRMTDLWYENDNFIYFSTFAKELIDACVQLICTLNEKSVL